MMKIESAVFAMSKGKTLSAFVTLPLGKIECYAGTFHLLALTVLLLLLIYFISCYNALPYTFYFRPFSFSDLADLLNFRCLWKNYILPLLRHDLKLYNFAE
jgi:hypothetical protein